MLMATTSLTQCCYVVLRVSLLEFVFLYNYYSIFFLFFSIAFLRFYLSFFCFPFRAYDIRNSAKRRNLDSRLFSFCPVKNIHSLRVFPADCKTLLLSLCLSEKTSFSCFAYLFFFAFIFVFLCLLFVFYCFSVLQ